MSREPTAPTAVANEAARKPPPLAPPPPGQPDHRRAITIGQGLKRPTGKRVFLAGDPASAIRSQLERHTGSEGWLSPHVWRGDRRAKASWEASVAVFVDMDCIGHARLDPELGLRAVEALRQTANLIYLTPHGVRAILVLDQRVDDAARFMDAARGAGELIRSAFYEAGVERLDVDFGANEDLARIFLVPNTIASCRHQHPECKDGFRRASVECGRSQLWSASELASFVPARKSGRGKRAGRSVRRSLVQGPGELAEHLLGGEAIEESGEIRFRCPLPDHADNNPSAKFNTEKGAWFCHVCQKGGGWEDLARRRGYQVPRRNSRPRQAQPLNRLPADCVRPNLLYRTIEADVPLHELAPKAIAELAKSCAEQVYVRGSKLVHVVTNALPPTAGIKRGRGQRIALIGSGLLRELLDRAARWVAIRESRKGNEYEAETWAPRAVVDAIRERGEWPGLRPLLGLLESPSLRPDGTVLDQEGYDQSTALLFRPARSYRQVAANPTDAEICAALNQLREPFGEFHLEAEADGASLIALMLTIAARPAVEGPVPHWAVMAPSFGAGKTLLVEAATIAMTGADPDLLAPVGGRPAEAEAEMRKRVTTLLLEAPRVAALDNVPDGDTLDSKVLAALLTSTIWTDRILGGNEKACIPSQTVWVSTGCNYRLWGDLARRSLSIVINPCVEDPHRRTFSIPDLRGYVLRRHPDLLVAALTILRGFFAAGCPSHGKAPLGKFEAWDRLIRAAVIWCTGLAGPALDPLETAARLQEESPDRGALAALLAAISRLLPGGAPATAKELVQLAISDDPLREAIVAIGGAKKGEPDSRALGNRLRTLKGRVVDGRAVYLGDHVQGVATWRVLEAATGGTRGSRGSGGGAAETLRAHTDARARGEIETAIHRPTTPTSPASSIGLDPEGLSALSDGPPIACPPTTTPRGEADAPSIEHAAADSYAAEERAAIQAEAEGSVA